MTRSASSIALNIPARRLLPRSTQGAEGFESWMRARFIDFPGVARASPEGVWSQLYGAHDQGYVEDGEFEAVSDRADKASRQLYHLIQHLEKNNGSGRVQKIPEE